MAMAPATDTRLTAALARRAATLRSVGAELVEVADRVDDPVYGTFRAIARRRADDLERIARAWDIARCGAERRAERHVAWEGHSALVPTTSPRRLVGSGASHAA